jgi:phosphatidylglycerol:prolipoprotein diacylglycerol transferase
MHPELIRVGPVLIHTYGAVLALAFVLAVGLARHAVRHALRGVVPMSEAQLVDWACWSMLGGIMGGRLLYVLLNWDVYAAHPQEIIAIWHGGLVWYGGFFGAALATWLYLRTHGLLFLRGAALVIPFVAWGQAVGRLGCFANGCCYGTPTLAWFGVQFPGHPEPVFPTQLVESASLVGLYVVLRTLQTPKTLRRVGTLFGVYLIGYAAIRGVLEFWRADQPLIWDHLTLHQLISLALLVVGGALIANRAPVRQSGGVPVHTSTPTG